MIHKYLALKAGWSRWIALLDGPKRRPLPVFANHNELGHWMASNLHYVSDPFGGAADFYTHPERTQWEVESRSWAWPCDCDDWAVYAYTALRHMPDYEPRIITLLDTWIKWSHVVCIYRLGDQSFVVDTSGYAYLGTGLNEVQERALTMAAMSRLFPEARYFGAVETPYPF